MTDLMEKQIELELLNAVATIDGLKVQLALSMSWIGQ